MHHGADNLPPASPPPRPAPPARPATLTRRIIASILLVVWTSLLAAGISVYFLTRAAIVNNLDETILARIASLPDIERPAAIPEIESVDAGTITSFSDRYVIQLPGGRRISSATATRPAPAPDAPSLQVVRREFTSAGSLPLRTLTVRASARRPTPDSPLLPVTVVYSAPADDVEQTLHSLLFAFGGFAILMAVGSLFAARSAAKVVLAPLQETSSVIGAINEQSLDRRINVDQLPAELTSVGTRLNDMLARLETAFIQRRQFLADASHELRTPVAALVTTLEVALRKRREPDDYVRSLESCLSDARLLHQLVAALLNQVRAQRFSTESDFAPAHVSTLLHKIADTAHTLASQKNIALSRSIPDHLFLLTDELKLHSIVMNLLANAVEYTPPGGHVWLHVELTPPSIANPPLPPSLQAALPDDLPSTPRRLLIRVSDNGPGIPPHHLPHLFEPFYRADAARTNPEQHLGLGLAIVQTNTASLGGSCSVRSPRPDNSPGTEFTLDLPAIDMNSADSNLIPTAPPPRPPLPQPMKKVAP